MAYRICLYCREKVHPDASVCRYCQQQLPAIKKTPLCRNRCLVPLFALALGIVTGAALLASEFFRERRNWIE